MIAIQAAREIRSLSWDFRNRTPLALKKYTVFRSESQIIQIELRSECVLPAILGTLLDAFDAVLLSHRVTQGSHKQLLVAITRRS